MKVTMKTREQLEEEGWKKGRNRSTWDYFHTGETRDPQHKIHAYDFYELAGKALECTKVHFDVREPYLEVRHGARAANIPWCAVKEHISCTSPEFLCEKYRENGAKIDYYNKFGIFDFDWSLDGQKTPKEVLHLVTWLAKKLGYKLVKVKKG